MDISRKTALDILIEFERSGTFPNLALKKHLRSIASSRDKAFITALVYGVIEKKILLDYYISKVSSVRLKKINIVILNILRLGLYQLIFLSTPESAACNSSVELAKKNGQYKSSGFVNAILRKLSVEYKNISLPEDTLHRLSVKYSLSVPIVEKLVHYLGEDDFENYMLSGNELVNNIYIAVNTVKTDSESLISLLNSENVSVQNTEIPNLFKLSGHINIEALNSFNNGLFHVIGLPSYLTALAVSPKPNDKIIDMCAAPGGKSFAMAYLSNDKAQITSFDLYEHKTKNISNDCKKLGLNCVKAVRSDSSKFNKDLVGYADRVLCDVPCSGLGVIFKKPDIKYKNLNFDELLELQSRILDNASKYLKIGGRLVYSTCTINPEENSIQIEKFLKRNNNFIIDNDAVIFGEYKGSKLFMPSTDKCDGFYIAVLKKIN